MVANIKITRGTLGPGADSISCPVGQGFLGKCVTHFPGGQIFLRPHHFKIFSYKNQTSALYCAYVLSSSYLLVFILIANFKIFLPSLSAVSIDNREGGWDPCLGYPMSSHDAHTVANNTIVGPIVSGSKPWSPLPNWRPPWVPLF